MRMTQRASSGTDADVERIVRRDFAEVHVAQVLATLGEYGDEDREPVRVRLAVLKLASRDLVKVRYWIEQAKCDYRDVLGPAEYPLYTKKWFRIDKMPDEEHNRIVQSDEEQYERWLEG